jgi:hypothetical protein
MAIGKKRQEKKAAAKRAAAIAANPDRPHKNDGYDVGVGVLHGPDLPTRAERPSSSDEYFRGSKSKRNAEDVITNVRQSIEKRAAAQIPKDSKTGYAQREDLHRVMGSYQPSPISGKTPSDVRRERGTGKDLGLTFTPTQGRIGTGSNEQAVDLIRASQGTPRNADNPTFMGKANYLSPVPDRGSNPARVVDHR